MPAAHDPRDRVTPTAFEIADPLLGVALAAPWRRALAAGVDVLLATVVANVGGAALVGVISAVLFVLVATRRPATSTLWRVTRAALVAVAALIVFGVITGTVGDALDGRSTREQASAPQLETDPDPAPVDSAASVEALRGYAVAVAAGDTLAADSLRAPAASAVAGPELLELARAEASVRALRSERDALRESVENPGFLSLLWALAADIGFAIGWLGVYVVLTVALWNGYSPGKKLLGIRVVRLDGGRVGLWTSFERLGGYAAGLVTGLLGFAQVLWDPNRQGVQDKIAGTVVVRTALDGTPRRAENEQSAA